MQTLKGHLECLLNSVLSSKLSSHEQMYRICSEKQRKCRNPPGMLYWLQLKKHTPAFTPPQASSPAQADLAEQWPQR